MTARSTPSQHLQAPWDRLSIASLASGAASAHGTRTFLIDSADRADWDGCDPRILSFQGFVDQARTFGAQLITLGLTPGDRILLLLPNCAEAAIALVGARFAGLIPVLASVDEAYETLRIGAERVEASAVITTTRVGSIRTGELARQIAAKVMSVRCVAGFGHDLPEGIEMLDGWSEQDILPLPALSVFQGDEALGTFQRDTEGRLVVAFRSEAQVIAEALAIATSHKMDRSHSLVQTLHPGSAAYVAAGLIMPLFTGMSMHLVGPFTSEAFIEAIAQAGPCILVAPADFAARVSEMCDADLRFKGISGLIALTRDASEIVTTRASAATTLLALGEQALVVRSDSRNGLIGDHHHPMPDVLAAGMPLLSITANATGFEASGFGAARLVTRGGAARAA